MPELLRPDVYVEEVPSPPGVPLVPVSTGAFVGVTARGPVDEATLIDSFTAYWNRFGGYRSDSFMTYAVKGFFDNGGSRCYIVRAADMDASVPPTTADSDLEDLGGDATAFNIATRDVGYFGNYIKYSTTKFETLLTTAIPITPSPGVSTCVLDDVSGIFRGDILYFDDGTDQIDAIVQSINLSTKTITFATPKITTAEIGVGARVATASQHRVTTQTTAAIPASAITSITVSNASAVRVGQVLTISDGTTLVSVVVTGVNGNEIIFGTVTPGAILATGALVVSQEFILKITDTGEELTPHQYLATQSTNREDYVENRLLGPSNESLIIEMQETSSSTTWQAIPLPVTNVALTGGTDGNSPADQDYIGTDADGRGLHALDKISDFNFLCVPGITTTAVQQGGADYAGSSRRQDIIFLCDPPTASDLPSEVRDWRLNTLNRDTSYAATYYPWIQIADPEVDGQNLYLPPSGHVMGVYSAVARISGPHTPPANIALVGVNGVQYEVSDGDHDSLNPIGVNVIRGYPGEGIRIMGARTLQNAQDGKHYVNVRNLTNFIKKSLRGALRQYLMQAIDPSLWGRITNTCEGFMLGIWRNGWLYPSDNQDEAYSVKCDRENNPQDVVNQGRVNVAVGFNPPYPAEFIVLRLSRIGGTVEVAE